MSQVKLENEFLVINPKEYTVKMQPLVEIRKPVIPASIMDEGAIVSGILHFTLHGTGLDPKDFENYPLVDLDKNIVIEFLKHYPHLVKVEQVLGEVVNEKITKTHVTVPKEKIRYILDKLR